MKILMIGFMFLSIGVQAAEISELRQFLSRELISVSNTTAQAPESSYVFKQFLLRVQGMVGIEVPWAQKLQIVPEIEMVWQKD